MNACGCTVAGGGSRQQHWACPTNRDVVHERRTFLASLSPSFSPSLLAASSNVSQSERRGRQLHHSEEKTPQSSRSGPPWAPGGGLCVGSGSLGVDFTPRPFSRSPHPPPPPQRCCQMCGNRLKPDMQHHFWGVMRQSCARLGGPALCRPRQKTRPRLPHLTNTR